MRNKFVGSGLSKRKNQVMVLFTLPILFLYAFFFLYPLIIGIYYSMTDWGGTSRTFDFIGFRNYGGIFKTLFSDSRFGNALWFNTKYVVLLVVGTIPISLGIALLLNRVKKFSSFFRSIYFIPAVLSLVTVGLIWNELFYRAIPLVGEFFNIESLKTSMLGRSESAIFGIWIVNLWQGCAIPTVLFLAGLQSIPRDLYESATIDGANALNCFRYITIPYLIPIFIIVLITTVKNGLTIFDYIMVLTGGGPYQSTESVGFVIYKHAYQEFKFGYSVAESMILFVIVAIVSYITIKSTSQKQVGE